MAGNGQGSVYHRPGRRKPWAAVVTVGWRNGQPVRVARYASSEKEANRNLRRLRAERDAGRMRASDAPMMSDYLEAWLVEVRRRRAPATAATYRAMVETWMLPRIGDVRIDDLTRGHVQDLVDAVSAQRRPATARLAHSALRAALSAAVRDELVTRNVALLVQAPPETAPQRAALGPPEARRLVAALTKGPIRPLVVTALASGARKHELLGLHWRDLAGAELRISGQLAWVDGEPVIRPPKTRSSLRTVTLPPFAVAALTRWRSVQRRERLAAGDRWGDAGLVFTDPLGEPLRDHVVDAAFAACLAVAGLSAVTFHSLRHTFATIAVAGTRDLKAASGVLGHSTIAETADTYAHLLDAQRNLVAAAMEEALG